MGIAEQVTIAYYSSIILKGSTINQSPQRRRVMTVDERLAKLEGIVEKGYEAVNKRIDDLNANQHKRIDDMRTLLIAILSSCILGVVAYIIKAFFLQ